MINPITTYNLREERIVLNLTEFTYASNVTYTADISKQAFADYLKWLKIKLRDFWFQFSW